MSKEFTKSYAINRIAELNEQIVEMTDNQNQTMRYLNRIRDENNQLKQQLAEKDKEINSLIADYEKRISQEQELMSNMEHRLTEKQNEIDKINKEFVQAVHDWKALCAEKDKEIEMLNTIKNNAIECAYLFKVALSVRQKDLAIQELEKVNGILTDTIIEVTQNEMDLNKFCYLEEISARFYEKMQEQIKELKGQHND